MKYRVAVAQTGSVPFNPQACIDKLEQFVMRAAGEGAQLVVFPEAFVCGYPKGASYGMMIGRRDPVGRDEFREYHAGAIEVPGPDVDRLCAIAQAAQVHLVVGVIERDGGTCYCTVLFIGPQGDYLGKHRKLMPTALERVIWGFGDGSTLTTVDTPAGKAGAVICWENYMPLLRTAMYAKGVALYCAPTADDRETWLPTMRHVAMEGRCFVLSSCQFLRKGDMPESLRVEIEGDADTILMRGGSVIVGPLGQILAGPVFDEETILYADLDTDELGRARFDFDVVGHYARPDVFRLEVNEAQQTPVVLRGSPQS